MDPEPPAADAAPSDAHPRSARVGIAVVAFLLLALLALAYHDGVLWTSDLSSLGAPGPYRVKGVVEHYDPTLEEIQFRQGNETRSLHWNLTQPATGWFVLDVQVLPNGNVEALSLTRVLVFRG